MINLNLDPTNFNKFNNLDSVETRIIEYLRDTNTADSERIWKILKYSDMRALYQDNLSAEEKNKLIYKDADEKNCRVFNFRYIEDSFIETCSLLKIYIYGITPTNHLMSKVNVGIDILSHNKLSNIYNDNGDILENGRPVESNISVKNRNTILLKSILTTLNGANIEGIGTLQFNQEMSEKCQAEMRLSNSKNFYGYTVVLSCHMGSLGVAENGFR